LIIEYQDGGPSNYQYFCPTVYAEAPGGWPYAVNGDEDAAVVVWASSLPVDLNDPLSDIRPELRFYAFRYTRT
jgi:hypothetical protein